MRRILLTGAAGGIGSMLRRELRRPSEIWRLSDIVPVEGEADEEIVTGDLTDLDFAVALCRDVDAIVHMAGNRKESPWDKLFGPNLIAVANLWEAARLNGVERIVFGSSNHVTGMYPVGLVLDESAPGKPDSRYGVTKVFAEGVGSLYADKFGIRSLMVRIGTYEERPTSLRSLSTWISARDLAAIVRVGLEAEYHYETVFGVSRNTRSWCDNSRAYALGYEPLDNAEDYAAEIESMDVGGVASLLQGGGSAGKEFAGDIELLQGRGQ